MKTDQQLIQEITALMADVWLAACERRVITPALDWKSHMVIDVREMRGCSARLPATSAASLSTGPRRWTSCGRSGTERVADAALMVADSAKAPMLNG